MYTFFIVFALCYFISFISFFNRRGYVKNERFFCASIATIFIVFLMNICNYFNSVDDVYYNKTLVFEDRYYVIKQGRIIFSDGNNVFLYIDDKKVKFKKTNGESKAIRYYHLPDSTLSKKWLINFYPIKIDSVIVYQP